MTTLLSTQLRAVASLIPYARNARTHSDEQVAQIAASIQEFGFNNPVLIDPDNGIIAGHGRVLAARKLGLTEVPVIVLAHLNENQRRAFRIADNKLAINAGWNEELLQLELKALQEQDFAVELTGFNDHELRQLLQQLDPTGLDPDEVPEPKPQAVSQPGELWRLGPHTVLCADGTLPAQLQRVLGGEPCDLVFTDPPYNVDYTGKTADRLKLANDDLGSAFGAFLTAACGAMLPVCAGALYICMSSSELHQLYAAFTAAGGHWSTFLIWVKDSFTLGRSDYQRQYEPILYGWPEGTPHHWCGERDQGDVWFCDRPRANRLHPTSKPVELVERAIRNSTVERQRVLDPFGGSGSTLIACENLQRRGHLVEIDPCYVDVILRRWQSYTGRQAYLDGAGSSFDELSASRLSGPSPRAES